MMYAIILLAGACLGGVTMYAGILLTDRVDFRMARKWAYAQGLMRYPYLNIRDSKRLSWSEAEALAEAWLADQEQDKRDAADADGVF